jgi:hypothetical protein
MGFYRQHIQAIHHRGAFRDAESAFENMTPAYYLLPWFLEGILTLKAFKKWLDHRSDELYRRDLKRKCVYALNGSKMLYKQLIYKAVMTKGQFDPFIGEKLRWDLTGKWVNSKKDLEDFSPQYRKQFALLPVIDHTNPYSDTLELEICSWQINYCKSSLTPAEFVALCKKVVDHCAGGNIALAQENLYLKSPPPGGFRGLKQSLKVPAKYFLPDFLQGICTLADYKKWLYVRARELFNKDRRLNRPWVNGMNAAMYKMLIHEAVVRGGLIDPFTGETMQYDLIGTWNAFIPTSHDPAVMIKFALLPTVDHINPGADTLAFEICSFAINKCKSSLNPSDFVALCEKIVSRAI